MKTIISEVKRWAWFVFAPLLVLLSTLANESVSLWIAVVNLWVVLELCFLRDCSDNVAELSQRQLDRLLKRVRAALRENKDKN